MLRHMYSCTLLGAAVCALSLSSVHGIPVCVCVCVWVRMLSVVGR